MSTLPKTFYRFNTIPINTPMNYLHRHRNSNPKMYIDTNNQELQIAKENVCEKNIPGGITLPDLKLHYKFIVTKIAWYWHKNSHIDNRIEQRTQK